MNNFNTALISMIGVLVFLLGVALLLGYHPTFHFLSFDADIFKYLFKVVPYRMYGLFGLVLGGLLLLSGARKVSHFQSGVADAK